MEKRPMRYIVFVLLLAGCESDVKKLQRLETEKLIACLSAQRLESDLNYGMDSMAGGNYAAWVGRIVSARDRHDTAEVNRLEAIEARQTHAAGFDTLRETWSRRRQECEIATRKYESFAR